MPLSPSFFVVIFPLAKFLPLITPFPTPNDAGKQKYTKETKKMSKNQCFERLYIFCVYCRFTSFYSNLLHVPRSPVLAKYFKRCHLTRQIMVEMWVHFVSLILLSSETKVSGRNHTPCRNVGAWAVWIKHSEHDFLHLDGCLKTMEHCFYRTQNQGY